MKINLFVSFYRDKNAQRDEELIFCLEKNIKAGFDCVHFLCEEIDFEYLINKKYTGDIKIHKVESRPTFNTFFEIMSLEDFQHDINIIANSDIFFDDLDAIRKMYDIYGRKTCLALSRWDYFPDGSSIHFDRADSQDTWIFLGNPQIRTSIEFTMGVGGCDNRLAYELQQNGYNVINPSKTIKTYHYHNSNIRYWIEDETRIPPPYLLLPIM